MKAAPTASGQDLGQVTRALPVREGVLTVALLEHFISTTWAQFRCEAERAGAGFRLGQDNRTLLNTAITARTTLVKALEGDCYPLSGAAKAEAQRSLDLFEDFATRRKLPDLTAAILVTKDRLLLRNRR